MNWLTLLRRYLYPMNSGLLINAIKTNIKAITNTITAIIISRHCFLPIYFLLRVYQDLPDLLVSHYNANMVADDTIGKLSVAIPAIPNAARVGFGTNFRSASSLRQHPSLLNEPINKFWLVNERRKTTFWQCNLSHAKNRNCDTGTLCMYNKDQLNSPRFRR